nr:PQQ-binding-like beta-propeller repeat protein [Haloarchaeobius litoreus]
MQPTIVNGTLYTAFHDGGKLYALDPETGEEHWNATPGGGSGSTWTTPAYANGVLYLGSNDYKLHAIDADTGTELWNYSTQTNVRSAPAVVDGVVYFGSNDGNVTAVNATTGEELWYYTMYQPVRVESNPAVVDGVVYIGGSDSNVTALDADTGAVVWRFQTPQQVESDPTVAENTVFVGSDNGSQTAGLGQIYALNATDGTQRWRYEMTGHVDSGQVYADGVVYGASRGGDLVALDAATGTEVWNYTGSDFYGAPVVAGDVLYISDFGNGTVLAFDATDGTERWQYDSPTGNTYPTVLAWNGFLYYGSGSHFYALEQPAPAITNVNATNPSGQDVAVSFDSDTQLVNISVSISGAGSATLTESDFTETGSVGSYTYTATYAGSSDGTYTATVDTAEDSDAKDGGDGESDSVTVDTTTPTVSEYAVSNPTGQDVTVSFNASEQLGTVEATVSGAESATLTLPDFTETDNGGNYTYTATYAGSSDGEYTVGLDTASDASGNDGAGGESDSVTVDTTAPTLSDYLVSNPDGRTVQVSFNASEQLSMVEATVGDTESATLTTGDFTETGNGDGTYGYTATYTGSSDGSYSVTLDHANDSFGLDGAAGESASITVDTVDPTADAGPDQTVDEDVSTSFDGSNSTDTVGVTSYEWDFGDGSGTVTGVSPSHTFSDPGTYTVTLTAADAAGNEGTDTLSVTVNDTTPPTVSDYTVLNPSGRTVQVVFNTSEQLATVEATVSGAGSIAFTTGDFVEVDNGDGTYTYGAQYGGSADGSYTVTLDTASDAAANDGAAGESASVTVDTTVPVLSNLAVTNPDAQNVTVSFQSNEQLAGITVGIDGAEFAILDRSNFTESGSGPYTYTATYEGGSDGRYGATVYGATDAAGNDGAGGQSADVPVGTAVVSSSVEHVSGSQPDMSNVTLDAWFSGGLLQVQAKNATTDFGDFDTGPDYELAGLGADDTTVLRATVTVQNATPRALIGSAHDATWTRTNNGNGTWTVVIEGSPAAVDSYFESDGSSPASWPGTIRANESQDAAWSFAVDDLSLMTATHRERLNGSVMTTDAQEFGSPQYDDSGPNDRVELHVKGPHFAADGTNNTGFFEAFLPQALLDDWGVTASELAGELDGASRNTTVTAVQGGGVRVDFGIHYSAADAAITVDTVAPTAVAGSNVTVTEDTAVSFDGSASTDNVHVASHEWAFGDGTNATGETVQHTYSEPGTYTATLTVTDGSGATDTDTVTVERASRGGSGSGGDSGTDDSDDGSDDGSGDGSADGDTVVTVDRDGDRNNESTSPDVNARMNVTVQNARANETVSIPFTDDGGASGNTVARPNLSVTDLGMSVSRDGDFTLNVTTEERVPSVTPVRDDGERWVHVPDRLVADDREFVEETGSRPVGYVTVEHSIGDGDIDGVGFTFEVSKRYLDERGVDADALALYRDETTRWNRLPTTVVGETGTHYRFEADSPGLSRFAIGVAEPVFEVSSAELDTGTTTVDEPVTLSVDVENLGSAVGTVTVPVTVDGEPVASRTVDVDARSTTTLTVELARPDAGTYDVAVDGEPVGSLVVEPRSTTQPPTTTASATTVADTAAPTSEATTDGGSGLPLLPVLGLAAALLAFVALGAWRRE